MMRRFILFCIFFIAINCFAQKPQNNGGYTIIVYERHPLSLSQYTYLITPEYDFYYQIGGRSPQTYYTKITEEQYATLFSEEYKSDLQYVSSNDSIVYNSCSGIDESAYGTITILVNGFKIEHIGQCMFPSGFVELFAFLHKNEPKFSRFTGKITRKSLKKWIQVSEMPKTE